MKGGLTLKVPGLDDSRTHGQEHESPFLELSGVFRVDHIHGGLGG